MKISLARTSAFDVLLRIERDRAYSSILLPIVEDQLSSSDRGLCHELVLGTLRKQNYLDRLIEHFSDKKQLDLEVRVALRLGLYQILYLDRVPEHAAVDESVSLVQRAKKSSAKGFVNAILRRSIRSVLPTIEYKDEVDRVSIESSHPRWLIERWIGEFGYNEAVELAAANNSVPPAAFRFTLKSDAESVDVDDTWVPSELVDGCFIAHQRDRKLSDLEKKGYVYFQDEASQMVAATVEVQDGERFLDVCAAPGSKTTAIASRVRRKGIRCHIVSGDLTTVRARLIMENCKSQGVDEISVIQYDATDDVPFADSIFDVVLVDAPCSGTGTIRHNPELRYFVRPGDITELSSKQLKILQNASKKVRSGGRIIYSTCSLEFEENEEVCRQFTMMNSDFRSAPVPVAERFKTTSGSARTFPHRDGLDGFFIASFERK